MSLNSTLRAGRTRAEAMMQDLFTAYAYEWVKVDGLDKQQWVQQGDPVRGKLPSSRSGSDATSARTVTLGGVERPIIEGGLHLPWSASPKVGWEYVLTTPGPLTHPSAVGRRFRVIEAPLSDHMTAWRLNVVEV